MKFMKFFNTWILVLKNNKWLNGSKSKSEIYIFNTLNTEIIEYILEKTSFVELLEKNINNI